MKEKLTLSLELLTTNYQMQSALNQSSLVGHAVDAIASERQSNSNSGVEGTPTVKLKAFV
jgi:hypothetical protein